MEDHQDHMDHHIQLPLMLKSPQDQHALPKRDHARQVPLPIQLSIPELFSTSQPDLLSTTLMEDHQDQHHHSQSTLMLKSLLLPDQHALPKRALARQVPLLTQLLIPDTFSTSQPDPSSTTSMEDHQDQLAHSQSTSTFNLMPNPDQLAPHLSARPELLPSNLITKRLVSTQWTTLYQTSERIKK
jgi:hypothetical protein